MCMNAVDGNDWDNDWWPQKTTPSSQLLSCGVGVTPLVNDMNGTRNANEGEIVWQVSVQKKEKETGKWAHSCGGVVIDKQLVLTSAECVGGSSEATVRSEAGIIDLPKGGFVRRKRQSMPDISYPGQQTPGLQYSQKVIIHPQFNESSLENNLALILLAQPFDLKKANGNINSICLSAQQIDSNAQLFVSGWGAIADLNVLRPKLQVIKANPTECHSSQTISNQLCVTQDVNDSIEDKHICQGDFGGPLFYSNGTNSILVGIYSSGNDCIVEKPAKFTEIQSYIKWIEEVSSNPYNS